MAWYDIFKTFVYAFTQDPLSKKTDTKDLPSAGVTSPDSVLDLRNLETLNSGGAFIRVQNELVDMTTATNRLNRYKEYDRLVMSVPEIEMAMTVFADESCVVGDTLISTVYYGSKSIEWLAKNKATEKFPIFCYDFKKEDYTIGWAYAPRYVKTDKTVIISLDNGETETVTPDHRILKSNGEWIAAGNLKFGDELMPFYKLKPHQTKIKTNQFPRIFSRNKGWMHERQFIDEWRTGKDIKEYERFNKVARLIGSGLIRKQIVELMGHDWSVIEDWIHKFGFTYKELCYLVKKETKRRVIGMEEGPEVPVYDLSVEDHKNFATDSLIMHNCQKDENNHCFKIMCGNKEVVEELEYLFFDRGMLNMDQQACWDKAKRLYIKGDLFLELIINTDNPKDGVYAIADLPAETMYRIETIKGKVLEFQQSKETPDYQAIVKAPIATATEAELQQSTAIRFAAEQIVHIKIGDYRRTFYPYGVSLIEAARGPAHQLRMMEDAMVIYRLTRAPERRVFYIDVGGLPPYKSEAFMDRIKDQFRKKKVPRQQYAQGGASAVEERWHAPAQDEDYWIPIRPNSNTKIDTLPGAQNLGEIDDAVYFRNKLFTALNFPKNYFSMEDPNATRITLSAQDVKFARMIERLQSHMEEGLFQIADRHLKLQGYPSEAYDDLHIKMTPPSDWRELSKAEITTNRINNASSLKSAGLMADFDIYVKFMKYTEDEAKEMLARLKIQKLEELKMQIVAQNPAYLGFGMPGQGEPEVGAEPGGPNPDMNPGGQPPPGGEPPGGPSPGPGGTPPPLGGPPPMPPPPPNPEQGEQAKPLPDPTHTEIIKYDLEIQDYESEQDYEPQDYYDMEF
jgi:Bacteriophage T4-like portal protein (Gp20)/Intein splicing domain